MRPVHFLLDEHVSRALQIGLRRRSPATDVLRVGDDLAPPLETDDPALLLWCEENSRVLVSLDHATLPDHFWNHLCSGRHSAGVLILQAGMAISTTLDDLLIVATASSSEDWVDRIEFLPL